MSDAVTEQVSETLKKTYIALKRAQARIEALEAGRAEPIAVIGMACRLPGGADDPAALWDLLCRGVDASGPIPAERWPSEKFYCANADVPGQTNAARAHFLRAPVDGFDAPFFGVSAKEATGMDPQQRLLLEVTWEALEDAGLDPTSLRGGRVGVVVGISSDDYAQAHRHSGQLDLIDGYSLTGTCFAPAAGRISYTFGFEGPSLAVDTACSSSLVAVHLACQSLRNGETTLALAAGVNLILSPVFHIASTKLGTISPDGRCKTFDASADGYGRGEGCGVVVLKRLSDARADGDRILAVIRGSAVNQDGRSNGLTAPNGLAQEKAIREALDRAGLTPSDIGYIEVHGTGTALGDPIEVEAIGRVMAGRPPERPVVLGTAKCNIGHLEAAAGIAGLIRAILCLRHGEIPPHLNLETPNPHIPWGAFPFAVATRRTPWPDGDGLRRAGVSSFGFSGTNAHVILEALPAPAALSRADGGMRLLPLSARTPEALRAQAARWRDWLESPATDLADACATAASGRAHMSHRVAALGRTTEELAAGLTGFLDGKPGRTVAVGVAETGRPTIAGLFTGQGSQYPGMGRGLYACEPVFRDVIDACDAAFGDRLGRRLRDVLYGADANDETLQQTVFAQPAIFAVELALYRLWESFGVAPDIVCGHSIGEYAAAYVAGVLSFADAVDMVAERGRLMQSLPAGGAMAAVFAGEAKVAPWLRPGDGVCLAAENTPEEIVVSGPAPAVAELLTRLAAAGISAQPLRVSHAFHSTLMRPIAPDFERVATRGYSAATLPVVSTVTGRKAAPGELGAARYWAAQIEAPVRFAAAAATLAAEGAEVFLEYGPSPILVGLARRSAPGEGRLFLPSMSRAGGAERDQMLDSMARLYARGVDIDWKTAARESGGRRVSAPSYPFQRKSYYRMPIVDAAASGHGAAAPGDAHPFLGQRIRSRLLPAGATLHQALFTAERPAFLREHQIFDKIISPAAAHLSMAFAAAERRCALEDVSFTAPLVVAAGAPRLVQLAVENDAYTLASQAADARDDQWVVHSAGRIGALGSAAPPIDLDAVRARCPDDMAPAAFYERIEKLGYSTGANFRCIRAIAKGDGEALCRVEAAGPVEPGAIHPGLIDSILQTVLPACEAGVAAMLDGESVLIPLHVGRVDMPGELPSALFCHTRVSVAGELVKAQISVCDAQGAAVMTFDDFLLKRADRATLYQDLREDDGPPIHRIAWRPFQPASAAEASAFVVFAEAADWGDALAERLRERGDPCLELRRAAASAKRGSDRYDLDPGDTKALASAVQPWLARNASRRVEVVFAWRGAASDPVRDCRAALAALLSILGAIRNGETRTRLWIVTRQAQSVAPEDAGLIPPSLDGAMLWGFGRAIARETPEIWGGLADVDVHPSASGVTALLAVIEAPAGEDEVAIRRGGQTYAARLTPARPEGRAVAVDPYVLDKGPRRTLDDLRFEPRRRVAPGPGQVEIEVLTAGLNFRDVLNALGQYPGEAGMLGFEAVGVVTALGAGVAGLTPGDCVIALAAPGCIASHVTVDRALVVPKPAELTAAEAVSLPAALLTAHYALHHLGGMRRGDRVLIHAAAGGVGLAAVQLALAAGAEVFATAGAPEKQAHLRAMGVPHVMSSRTLEFADRIRETTGGRGVDMVLNSLSGDFIAASFSVLAPGGRFLEMGKLGVWDEARVRATDPSWLYRPFDLAAVARQEPAALVAMFERLLADVRERRLALLPVTVFPMEEAAEAFRYMAQARHIGKIVLSREDEHRRSALLARGVVLADASYLVTGGLGALGLRLAGWLVDAGARHLVLAGRGAPGEAAAAAIAAWEARGAAVTVVRGDVSSGEDVARMVAAASRPPLAGVVHAAGLLEDGMIADLDEATLERVMAPKVAGAWRLHEATRGLELDFFVLFSSIAAIIGNLGQGAYAAANAFMDGLAALRRREGLPATTINWGPWAETGMAASLDRDRFAAQGIRSLTPARGLRAFGGLLAQAPIQAIVADVDWPAYCRAHGRGAASGLFAELASPADGSPTAAREEATARDIVAELQAALPVQREEIMRRFLRDLARQTLGYGESEPIASDQSLVDQGFDSLMSVDMRNRLNRCLGRALPASLLFDYPTLDRIGRHLLEAVIVFEAEESRATREPTAGELLDDIERLVG